MVAGCCALAFASGMLAAGCSPDEEHNTAPTTTSTVANGSVVSPPLPVDVNQIPYRFTDRIALGDWQFAIQKLTDPAPQPGLAAPEGTRLVAIDLTVRNGALKAQTMRPDVFWLYDGAGKGSQPLPAAAPSSFNRPLPSDGTRTGRLVFAVPEGEGPAVLLFRGTETYGQKVLNGIVSLDPDWTPAEPDL